MLLLYSLTIFCFLLPHLTSTWKTWERYDWENIFNNYELQPVIPLHRIGNNLYYIGDNIRISYLEAAELCKNMHMNLISLDTHDEFKHLDQYISPTSPEDTFWTSGSKWTDGVNYVWMTTGRLVDHSNLTHVYLDEDGDCLAIKKPNTQDFFFQIRNCHKKFGLICERPITPPDTDEDSALKWQSLFHNSVAAGNTNGLNSDEKFFYFGKFLATQSEAAQICKLMNMQLVSVTSEATKQMLYAQIKNSSSKQVDGDDWVWINLASPVEYNNWAIGEPSADAEKKCLLLSHDATDLTFNSFYCNARTRFICESSHNCDVPDAPVAAQNQADATTTATYDGRTFLFVDEKATQTVAAGACKRKNMELISITDQKTEETVTKFLKDVDQNDPSQLLWINGIKDGNEGWVWRHGGKVVGNNWATGQPDNALGDELCLAVNGNGTWEDSKCKFRYRFICASPVDQKKSTDEDSNISVEI